MSLESRPSRSELRRWHGYDWAKLVVAGVLAASLIRVGPGGAAPPPQPTAAPMAAATAAPTAAPTAVATTAPTTAPTPAPVATATAAPMLAPTDAPTAASTSAPPQLTAAASGALTISAPAEGARIAPGKTAVSGTGSPGAEIEVLNSDQVLSAATVGADGVWSAEVDLPTGTAVISARVKGTDESIAPVQVTVGSPEENSCATLAAGCQVWVTRAGGLRLRLRSSPAIQSDNIVSRLPIGAQMELLEGPTSADGYGWWRVRTLGGQAGWAAGENLVLQPD